MHNELTISVGEFSGYKTIVDMMYVMKVIDKNIYEIEHLNDNILKIKVKS